jgi:hypothetical protein
MTTFEVSDPVALIILMKADDLSRYRRTDGHGQCGR